MLKTKTNGFSTVFLDDCIIDCIMHMLLQWKIVCRDSPINQLPKYFLDIFLPRFLVEHLSSEQVGRIDVISSMYIILLLIQTCPFLTRLSWFSQVLITNFVWNKAQFWCTIYQCFLHIVAVGGLHLPTNQFSKGVELLATGQLSNSSPIHHHTYQTHIQTSNA